MINHSHPRIEISLVRHENYILLSFFDNGPGYDGNIDNFIKPYFSTKNSSGLGLPLINKIIR